MATYPVRLWRLLRSWAGRCPDPELHPVMCRSPHRNSPERVVARQQRSRELDADYPDFP